MCMLVFKMSNVSLSCTKRYRQNVKKSISLQQYQSALFWADKVATLTNGEAQDMYVLGLCLYLNKQYHRCCHCLKSKRLEEIYLCCRYLTAKCHYEAKEYQEALEVLENQFSAKPLPKAPDDDTPFLLSDVLPSHLESAMHLLKGRIYEAMDNRGLASESFKEALKTDIYCSEAFDSLVQHQMLTAQEEKELLELLPFKKQCSEEEAEVLKYLYESKLKKYHRPEEQIVPVPLEPLKNNNDLMVNRAERCYYNCDYMECYKLTSNILNNDPYHTECLPIHIAVLVDLEKATALFYLAHKLVDLFPESATSWFAVGCYYSLTKKYDSARRYLGKATSLDRVFGPAWLAYGHSFAVEKEHDQAMAAYFKASQLMKGCHLPLLYIGLENGLTKLAERFFSQALTIAPEDPFVLHEMGVIAFQNQDWSTAEKYHKQALEKVQSLQQNVLSEKWEPLLNNLGHTCRKLKKYQEALDYHQQALVLSPLNPSTFAAIGYVYALMGNNTLAVDYFHKALSRRRDDTFSTTMLGNVTEQLMNEMTPCEGAVTEVPMLDFPSNETSTLARTDLDESRPESVANVTSDSCMAVEMDTSM